MNDLNDAIENGGLVIASLFMNEVQVAMSLEEGVAEDLYPEEQVLIAHAIRKRQSDFASGRMCAKKALAKLGVNMFPILMDLKGAPIWPEGVTGSISHARGCCAAVVARMEDGMSIGFDIEESHRIEKSIWDYAFGTEEVNWLEGQLGEAQKWSSVIFAAKEAFYKAQYPVTHSWLGFKDVTVIIDRNFGTFTLRLLVDLGKWIKGTLFKGRYGFFDKYVVAGIRTEVLERV